MRSAEAAAAQDFVIFVPNATLERDGHPPPWLQAPDIKVIATDVPLGPEPVNSEAVNQYMQARRPRRAAAYRAARLQSGRPTRGVADGRLAAELPVQDGARPGLQVHAADR